MATRFYFPSSGAAPASPTINAGGEWNSSHVNSSRTLCVRSTAVGVTGLTNFAYSPDGADDGTDTSAHARQFVTAEQLQAQTIDAGAVKWAFQVQEAHANNNQVLAVKIFVCSSGGTIKETLLGIQRDGTEMPSTGMVARSDTGTLSAVTVEDGDRLCFEVGWGGSPGGGGGVQGHNATIRFGENAAGGDLPEDDADTGTTLRPWLEFSQTLLFQGDPVPVSVAAVPTRMSWGYGV